MADRDRIAVPAGGGIWVEVLDRHGLFISSEEIGPGQTLLPLSEFSWLLMFKDSRVRTASTRETLAQGTLWPSLSAFHAIIFEVLFLNAGLAAVDVYNLLTDWDAQQRRNREDGLARLASVMDSAATRGKAPAEYGDQLASAMSRVARELGLSVTEPRPQANEAVPRPLTVEDIARTSHFNVRRVILKEGWWRQDTGPMLGFTAEDGKPIPLIPVSATAYETYDPDTENRSGSRPGQLKGYRPHAPTPFTGPFRTGPSQAWT